MSEEEDVMLTAVPYYRIPRDEDGRPSRHFDRAFTMALRWQPDMADAIDYYENSPDEPYPGRNAEAARDLHELLDELTS